MIFFTKYLNLKKNLGGGGGRGWRGDRVGEGGPSVNELLFTKNSNLKKNYFGGGGGGQGGGKGAGGLGWRGRGARVSDFFFQRIQIEKKFGGGGAELR